MSAAQAILRPKGVPRLLLALMPFAVQAIAGPTVDARLAGVDCRAAEMQFDLDLMRGNGTGVPQEYGETVRWRKKSAAQRYPQGRYSLGD